MSLIRSTILRRCATRQTPLRYISRGLKTSSIGGKKQELTHNHPTPDLPPPLAGMPKSAQPSSQTFNVREAAKKLPPDYSAKIRELKTFDVPDTVTGTEADRRLGKELVNSWRTDGILQINFPPDLKVLSDAIKQSKAFFAQENAKKAACVDSQSFAGYIASGEEITDGVADYSEIFTVTKDLDQKDARVQARWPCHGPNPWPRELPEFSSAIAKLMEYKGEIGEKLLRLTALGLGLKDPETFNKLTKDGWHHMRVLRFPPTNATNGKGKAGRGIGSHTDYGLLVIAAQDEVGGLFVRPPIEGESYANWNKSAAGAHENDDNWLFVPPVENTFTVFTGDMMSLLTNDVLPSTPHKVGLNTTDRFAFAYFHEPNFNAICKRLPEFGLESAEQSEEIHYGTHFSNMFMGNYPERITAKRMEDENRMASLESIRKENGFSV